MDAHHLIDIEPNPKVQDFRPGDTIRVSIKVTEGDRQRTQAFEGVVIRKRGGGPGASFTVRRISHEIGVGASFTAGPSCSTLRQLRGWR